MFKNSSLVTRHSSPRILSFLFASAAIAVCPDRALAQGQGSGVSMVTHEAFGWHFTPVVVNTQLRGFFASNADNEAFGGNFTLTWFERGSDGRWSAWAWPAGTTAGEAIAGIAMMVDGFDPALMSGGDGAAAAEPVVPNVLQNGLVWNDPLQEVVASFPEPQLVVSALAEAGLEAAPVLSAEMVESSTQPGVWPFQTMLDALAARSESLMFASSGSVNPTWPCWCVKVFGNTCTPAAGAVWVLDPSPLPGGATKCTYRRESTVAYWYVDKTFFWCGDCGPGGTVSAREVCIIQVLPGETCPPMPPSDCATSCIVN